MTIKASSNGGESVEKPNLRKAQTPTALYIPFGNDIFWISLTAFFIGPNSQNY